MILLMLWLLPFGVAVFLLLSTTHWSNLWKERRPISEAAAGLLLASFPFLWMTPFAWPTMLILSLIHIWMVILAARLLFGRLDEQFIRGSTWVNCLIVIWVVVAILCGHWLVGIFSGLQNYEWRFIAVLLLGAIAGIILIGQLLWSLKHFKLRKLTAELPTRHLPTVSVCIPARNEDHALMECLTSVLSSDYPKMDVLVLDDCSQDSTSQIVRSFAHDGVRFIQGDVPADGWLGKNQAMQSLAEHASGEILLFMGVDTRLDRQSITLLVNYLLSNKLDMVAVLPQNRQTLERSNLLGTLQYFWQVALPITKRRVPVSSKCWMISAKMLQSLGGFASVRHKIVPEGSFARRLFSGNTYRFIVSNSQLGITATKQWSSQINTSLRILYPTLKRQPLFALGGFLACLVFLFPFAMFAWQLFSAGSSEMLLVSFSICVVFLSVYALVLARTQPRVWFVGLWLFPFVIAQEAVLILVSMLQYEFGRVDWKGRNVCYPVISNGQISKRR